MRYFKKLTGERIYLSPMNKDDAEIYTKWLNDAAVSGYLGNFSSMVSLDSEQRALERMTSEGCNFAIVRLSDDTLIGNISLNAIHQIDRNATVGVFIGEAVNRGKGFGTEALRLILNYGFKTLNLHNIALTVHADNECGLACYKKVGFREYGRRHESKFKDGRYVDLVYMELLDSEFSSAL
jgi:RimJ/RimL family protein N-acetyltransferase